MKEIKGDIWKVDADALCITTNGFVKKNGECVMGAGIAKDAAQRYPNMPKKLGSLINKYGNIVHIVGTLVRESIMKIHGITAFIYIVAFPVKHHFKDRADLELIKKSCKELVDLADHLSWQKVVLIKPGCGCGKLDWEKDVKPVIAPLLDDRFEVIDFV